MLYQSLPIRLILAFFLLSIKVCPSLAASTFIIVQSTTSIQNSGLYDHLLPTFKDKNKISAMIVAVGTGQALKNAEKCDADLVIAHSTADEKKFVANGFGSKRYNLMHNEFVLVGPRDDPAEVRFSTSVTSAFRKIAKTRVKFASRADDSGTHKAELRFWAATEQTPENASGQWYLETGLGMGGTLNFAVQSDAYTLTDNATWATFKNKAKHKVLFQGDSSMFNQYGIVTLSKKHCPNVKSIETDIFVRWLLSPEGQAMIASYKPNKSQLFHPNASQ